MHFDDVAVCGDLMRRSMEVVIIFIVGVELTHSLEVLEHHSFLSRPIFLSHQENNYLI